MKSYLQGTWYAVLGETVTVLLPPAERERVAGTWDLVDRGAGAPEVLDLLLAGGLSPLSGFALVVREGEGVRALARGNVRVQLHGPGGVVTADGTGAMTWVDQQADVVTSVTVDVDSEVLAPDTLLVGPGLVRVARLEDPAPAGGAAVEVQQGEVQPVEAPVVVPAAEPVVETPAAPEPVASPAPEPAPVVEPVVAPAVVAEPVELPDVAPVAPEVPEAPAAQQSVEQDPSLLSDLPTETFDAVAADLAPSAPTFDVDDVDTGDPLGMDPVLPAPLSGAPTLGGDPVPQAPRDPFGAPNGFGSTDPAFGAPLGAPGHADPFAPVQEPYEDHDGRTHSGLMHDVDLPVTGIPGQPQAPAVTAAPVARLVLSTGDTIDVDRAVLFGRAPEARRFQVGEEPRLVTVPSPHQEISSTHLEVRPGSGVDHGAAVVTDLGSTNGTVVVQPGLEPEELQAGIAVQLIPGAIIDLGDGVTIHVTAP